MSINTPETIDGIASKPTLLPRSLQSSRMAFSTSRAMRSRSVSDGATDGGTRDRWLLSSRATSRATSDRALYGSKPSGFAGGMLNEGKRSLLAAPGVPGAPDGTPSPVRGDGSVTVAEGRAVAPVVPLEPLAGGDALVALAGADAPDGAALAGDALAAEGAAAGAGVAAAAALGQGCARTGVATGAATGCADAAGAAAAGTTGAGTGVGTGVGTDAGGVGAAICGDGTGAATGTGGATGVGTATGAAGAALAGSAETGGGVGAAGSFFAGGASTTSFTSGNGRAGSATGGGVTGSGGVVAAGVGAFGSVLAGVTSSGGCMLGAGLSGLTSTVGVRGTVGVGGSAAGRSTRGIGGSSSSARGMGADAFTVTVVVFGASEGRCSVGRGAVSGAGIADVSRGTSLALMRVLTSCCASPIGARQPKLSPPTSMVITVRWMSRDTPMPHSRPRCARICMSCATARVSVRAMSKCWCRIKFVGATLGAIPFCLTAIVKRVKAFATRGAPTSCDGDFKSVCASDLSYDAWC